MRSKKSSERGKNTRTLSGQSPSKLILDINDDIQAPEPIFTWNGDFVRAADWDVMPQGVYQVAPGTAVTAGTGDAGFFMGNNGNVTANAMTIRATIPAEYIQPAEYVKVNFTIQGTKPTAVIVDDLEDENTL